MQEEVTVAHRLSAFPRCALPPWIWGITKRWVATRARGT
jgi:hypothetical protein